jgi:two-component system chemotaxis sensor kinase CheA
VDPLLQSLLQDFVEEGLALAGEVGTAVLELEAVWAAGRDHEDVLRQMKSALHTLKGAAAMMGLQPIETLAHGLEDVCARVGEDPARRGRREIELLLAGADLMLAQVRRAGESALEHAPTQAFLGQVEETLRGSERPAAEAAPVPAEAASLEGGLPAEETISIRIADAKVDELMELAGETLVSHTELVRLQALASKGRLDAADLARLDQVVGALGRTTTRLRDELLRVRLMPVSSLFVRFRRYVRDLSRERGQPISLTIEGAETALDRAVLGRLHEPLLHMVRNAVAHGLESPAERAAAGKPPEANILLAAKLVSGGCAWPSSTTGGASIWGRWPARPRAGASPPRAWGRKSCAGSSSCPASPPPARSPTWPAGASASTWWQALCTAWAARWTWRACPARAPPSCSTCR